MTRTKYMTKYVMKHLTIVLAVFAIVFFYGGL